MKPTKLQNYLSKSKGLFEVTKLKSKNGVYSYDPVYVGMRFYGQAALVELGMSNTFVLIVSDFCSSHVKKIVRLELGHYKIHTKNSIYELKSSIFLKKEKKRK